MATDPNVEMPERIEYLAPVLNALSKFDSESLGDDNPEAVAIVETAVRSRLKGMSKSDARATLQQDTAALGEWMRKPDTPPTAHYLYGNLMGMCAFADFGELVK